MPILENDRPFLVWILVGVILPCIIGFFGTPLIDNNYFTETITWNTWTLGSILATFLFTVIFYCKFKFTRNDTVDRIIFGVLIIGGIGSVIAIFILTLFTNYYSWQMISTLGIPLTFFIVDYLMSAYHYDKVTRNEFKVSIFINDAPMLISFLLIIIYCLFINNNPTEAPIFFSGVIAFQLIFSNTIFAVLQSNFYKSIQIEINLSKN